MLTRTLTAERLRSRLHYDPETGIFTRNGAPTGRLNRDGYIMLSIDDVDHQAHRVAWLYVAGNHPDDDIDHRDLDRTNNRFANLRECNGSQNRANIGTPANNTSGFKGVTRHKSAKKWQAKIQHDGKAIYLGLHDCPVAAHLAYALAAERIYGEFARMR